MASNDTSLDTSLDMVYSFVDCFSTFDLSFSSVVFVLTAFYLVVMGPLLVMNPKGFFKGLIYRLELQEELVTYVTDMSTVALGGCMTGLPVVCAGALWATPDVRVFLHASMAIQFVLASLCYPLYVLSRQVVRPEWNVPVVLIFFIGGMSAGLLHLVSGILLLTLS